MPANVILMSYSAPRRINVGAYDRPFSGVGIEYYPLNSCQIATSATLHECGYLPKNKDWNFPSVFSPFWRLYYNSRRGHCVVFGQDMIELTPDHIVLIPDHHLFHCLGKQPVSTFWLAFSVAKKLHHDHKTPVLLTPSETELCLIKDLSNMVTSNTHYKPTEQIYQYSSALLNVILCRSELMWQPPMPENLKKALLYIEDHLQEKITNPSLATAAGISAESLYRLFRKCLNSTPSRYITERRISEACRLLLHSDQSIDEIAFNTGFPNRSYFSRIFHKTTKGEWPASFKNKHRTKER